MTTDRKGLENELLVVRCQVGERDAWDSLVERWHRPLWQFVRGMVEHHDQAEEAVQETWIRVLRGLPRLREAGKFAPWFYGIARRVLMDRLRAKYTRGQEMVESDELAREWDPAPLDAEIAAALHQQLERLPLLEREVLTLFYVVALSIHEVAEVTEVPLGTVKSRLHRARRRLRTSMTSSGALP